MSARRRVDRDEAELPRSVEGLAESLGHAPVVARTFPASPASASRATSPTYTPRGSSRCGERERLEVRVERRGVVAVLLVLPARQDGEHGELGASDDACSSVERTACVIASRTRSRRCELAPDRRVVRARRARCLRSRWPREPRPPPADGKRRNPGEREGEDEEGAVGVEKEVTRKLPG